MDNWGAVPLPNPHRYKNVTFYSLLPSLGSRYSDTCRTLVSLEIRTLPKAH